MILCEPFGLGRLFIEGRFREVRDHVVPNDACGDPVRLLDDLPNHPILPDYLDRGFQRRTLPFSTAPCPAPPWSTEARRIAAAFFHEGRAVACEAVLEGVRHFFLGRRIRRLLRARVQSVVRRWSDFCLVKVDTRAEAFDYFDPPTVRTPPLPWSAFAENRAESGDLVTDYVVPRSALVFLQEFDRDATLIGALEPGTPIRDHFGPFQRGEPPWADGFGWEVRGRPPLAAALAGAEGWRIFLTREGYRRLESADRAVVRGIRPGEGSPLERLEVLWSPKEVRP